MSSPTLDFFVGNCYCICVKLNIHLFFKREGFVWILSPFSIFLLFSFVFFALDSSVQVFAQGTCVLQASGVCGGATNPVTGVVSNCSTGYRCQCTYSQGCSCVIDPLCGAINPNDPVCGSSTAQLCGVAGGCGPYMMRCGILGTGGYGCYNDATCSCEVGMTCPGDVGRCINGECRIDDSGTIIPPGYDDPAASIIRPYQGPIISNITGLLSPIFKILFYAGIFIGFLGIIYSGYLFISSEGDPGRVKEGREQFTAAVLGSLFVLLSVFIIRVIINEILGVDSGL